MSAEGPRDVIGTSLAGDKPYVISADENRALCASVGVAPAADGSAHPAFYYIATQVGMGTTVAGLCKICDFDVDDGPLMGGTRVAFQKSLMTEQPYHITGEIIGLTRKQSRKLGTMDILEFRLSLSLPNGAPVLSTTNTWMLPRRSLS